MAAHSRTASSLPSRLDEEVSIAVSALLPPSVQQQVDWSVYKIHLFPPFLKLVGSYFC